MELLIFKQNRLIGIYIERSLWPLLLFVLQTEYSHLKPRGALRAP